MAKKKKEKTEDIPDKTKVTKGSTEKEKKVEKKIVEKEKKTKREEKKEIKELEEKKKEEKKTEGVVEEKKEIYKVKKKPQISEEIKRKLLIRKKIKDKTPVFLRQEWFRYKRLGRKLHWRKPKGMTSKLRMNLGYRPSIVRVGFRVPREVRGLHPSGFKEVIVYNINDLSKIDPKTQAARIGATVGTKKRMEIKKKAEELDIRVLNM